MVAPSEEIYGQFARIGRALANPTRLHLLDLLGHGERSVEELAEAAGTRLQNTSAQLQQLRAAQLVSTRREGNRIYYQLAAPEVGAFLRQFRDFGEGRLSELRAIAATFLAEVSELDPVPAEELDDRRSDGNTVIIDVRPAAEYAAAHIPGAVSLPAEQLHERLAELPEDAAIVAYCRGPYCVLAPNTVRRLRDLGRSARPLLGGFGGWRDSGRPVSTAVR